MTICVHAVLSQGGCPPLSTARVSMATSLLVLQSLTLPLPMVTSVKTAVRTLKGQSPLPHTLRHHHLIRLQRLPLMLSTPPHHHLSQVYTPETGVGGTRQVSYSGGSLTCHIKCAYCCKFVVLIVKMVVARS